MRWIVLLVASLVLSSAGCEKPVPPTIEPEAAKVTSVATTGLDLSITLKAKNPNKMPLIARKVKARVKLADEIDLGEVSVDTRVDIPSKGQAEIVVPLPMKWGDVGAVVTMAYKRETIPFTVEGTAELGFEKASFEVPFKTTGTLTRDQIKELGMKNLPQLPIPLPTALPF